ncbi:TIP-1 family-domain-containing protein [Desarmillaria tabescens]|uniref:TIP-1 family-domain-containing protein n=1 Tax=Armillaria tabescens TaxID=1929756 RepID=A0AA39NGH8_ARMTA|nr:TIP-1 family-domain-containing protein [Desarmillaria tabescens]KAK0465211.1 TIP-1 family-domain-containing protein [Desarmillaria tabescens]
MSSQEIQSLLAPADMQQAYSKASVYLNSKFILLEDLGCLEKDVEQAQQCRDQLEARLALSQSKINILIAETQVAAEAHRRSAQELSLERHSLTDELANLSQDLLSSLSDVNRSPTLLEDIETLHRNLKELKSVKEYVQTIEHALNLSELAVQQISASSSVSNDSVTQYRTLRAFVTCVSDACSGVGSENNGGKLGLVAFLERLRETTWSRMKAVLSNALLSAAEKLKWPTTIRYPSLPLEDRVAFEKSFCNLLELQNIGQSFSNDDAKLRSEKDGLYPLETLVLPLSLRFKYHFEGDRQTNQLHKPEWYFTHVLNAVNDHQNFMESVVQQLLSSTKYKSFNAWHEFTLLLFPLLSRKLRRTVPLMLSHPSLLAHTIYQALSFDAALVEEGFTITDTSSRDAFESGQWPGVADIILGRKEWFEAWIDGEKKFAEDQYHEIISTPDAWQIAEDERSRHLSNKLQARHTRSSTDNTVDTLILDRYSPLPNFTQRTRFLISVQLPILELYHGRILSSLDAFETLSSALVRAVPGALGVNLGGKEDSSVNVDTRSLTSGVSGVQRLCKALLSANYLEISMEAWGEEVFFLELWIEIKKRASLRARAQADPLLPDPKVEEDQLGQETIFGELITHYRMLSVRAQDMIVQQVCAEVEGNLRPHLTITTSPNPGADAEQDEVSISQTLLAPIALLSTHLGYIRMILPQSTVTLLYRRIASRLSEHIMQRQILYRGNVAVREAREIQAECELWVETSQGGLAGALGGGRNRVEAPWSKLLEAGRLIAAEGPAWDKAVDFTFGAKSEDQWDAAMVEITGFSELSREEVGRVLRRRKSE